MKLSEAIKTFIAARQVSQKTREHYRIVFASFPPDLLATELSQVTIGQLRAWSNLVRQRPGQRLDVSSPNGHTAITAATHHYYLRNCQTLFNWFVGEGLLPVSPAARLEKPQLPKVPAKGISDENLTRLLEAAQRSRRPFSQRDYALVRFLADTGCRSGGAAGLLLEDLDLKNKRALVYEKGRGGQKKARLVYYGQRTADALRAWLIERDPGLDAQTVFVGRTRQPLTGNGINHLFRRLAIQGRVAGRANPHSLRHAWARRALQNGLDLGAVSQVLGHSSIRVTHQFYAFYDEGDLPDRHSLGRLADD